MWSWSSWRDGTANAENVSPVRTGDQPAGHSQQEAHSHHIVDTTTATARLAEDDDRQFFTSDPHEGEQPADDNNPNMGYHRYSHDATPLRYYFSNSETPPKPQRQSWFGSPKGRKVSALRPTSSARTPGRRGSHGYSSSIDIDGVGHPDVGYHHDSPPVRRPRPQSVGDSVYVSYHSHSVAGLEYSEDSPVSDAGSPPLPPTQSPTKIRVRRPESYVDQHAFFDQSHHRHSRDSSHIPLQDAVVADDIIEMKRQRPPRQRPLDDPPSAGHSPRKLQQGTPQQRAQAQTLSSRPPSIISKHGSILVSRTEQELVRKVYRGMEFGSVKSQPATVLDSEPVIEDVTPNVNKVLEMLQMVRQTASADELKLLREALAPVQPPSVSQARAAAEDPLSSGDNARLIRKKSLVVVPGTATRIASSKAPIEQMPPTTDPVPKVPNLPTAVAPVVIPVSVSAPTPSIPAAEQPGSKSHPRQPGADRPASSSPSKRVQPPPIRTDVSIQMPQPIGQAQGLSVPRFVSDDRVSTPGSVDIDYPLVSGFTQGSLFIINGAPSPDVSEVFKGNETAHLNVKAASSVKSEPFPVFKDTSKPPTVIPPGTEIGNGPVRRMRNPSKLTIEIPVPDPSTKQTAIVLDPSIDHSPLERPLFRSEDYRSLLSPFSLTRSHVRGASITGSVSQFSPVLPQSGGIFAGPAFTQHLAAPSPGFASKPIRRRQTLGSLVRRLKNDDDDLASQAGGNTQDPDVSFLSSTSFGNTSTIWPEVTVNGVTNGCGRNNGRGHAVQPSRDSTIEEFLPLEAVDERGEDKLLKTDSGVSRRDMPIMMASPALSSTVVESFPRPPGVKRLSGASPDKQGSVGSSHSSKHTAGGSCSSSECCPSTRSQATSRPDSMSLAESVESKSSDYGDDRTPPFDQTKAKPSPVKTIGASTLGLPSPSRRPHSSDIFGPDPFDYDSPEMFSALGPETVKTPKREARNIASVLADEIKTFEPKPSKSRMNEKEEPSVKEATEKTKPRPGWRLFRRSVGADGIKPVEEIVKKEPVKTSRAVSGPRRLQKPRPSTTALGRSRPNSPVSGDRQTDVVDHSNPPQLPSKPNAAASAVEELSNSIGPDTTGEGSGGRRSRRKSRAADEERERKRRPSLGRRLLNLRRRSKSAGRMSIDHDTDEEGESGADEDEPMPRPSRSRAQSIAQPAVDATKVDGPKVKGRRSLGGLGFRKSKPVEPDWEHNPITDALPHHPTPTNGMRPYPGDRHTVPQQSGQLTSNDLHLVSSPTVVAYNRAAYVSMPSLLPKPSKQQATISARPKTQSGPTNNPPKFASHKAAFSHSSLSTMTGGAATAPGSPGRKQSLGRASSFTSIRSFWEERPDRADPKAPASKTPSQRGSNMNGLGLQDKSATKSTGQQQQRQLKDIPGWPLTDRRSLAVPDRRSQIGRARGPSPLGPGRDSVMLPAQPSGGSATKPRPEVDNRKNGREPEPRHNLPRARSAYNVISDVQAKRDSQLPRPEAYGSGVPNSNGRQDSESADRSRPTSRYRQRTPAQSRGPSPSRSDYRPDRTPRFDGESDYDSDHREPAVPAVPSAYFSPNPSHGHGQMNKQHPQQQQQQQQHQGSFHPLAPPVNFSVPHVAAKGPISQSGRPAWIDDSVHPDYRLESAGPDRRRRETLIEQIDRTQQGDRFGSANTNRNTLRQPTRWQDSSHNQQQNRQSNRLTMHSPLIQNQYNPVPSSRSQPNLSYMAPSSSGSSSNLALGSNGPTMGADHDARARARSFHANRAAAPNGPTQQPASRLPTSITSRYSLVPKTNEHASMAMPGRSGAEPVNGYQSRPLGGHQGYSSQHGHSGYQHQQHQHQHQQQHQQQHHQQPLQQQTHVRHSRAPPNGYHHHHHHHTGGGNGAGNMMQKSPSVRARVEKWQQAHGGHAQGYGYAHGIDVSDRSYR